MMGKFLWLPLMGTLILGSAAELNIRKISSCYDYSGLPKACVPEFENIALDRMFEATSTCGANGATHYCVPRANRAHCQICNDLDHAAKFLTDDETPQNTQSEDDATTWWQSETLLGGINQVNLTLSLNKAYDITFIRLKFHSSRPDHMAIYKRTTPNSPWIPYQYFSSNCSGFYGTQDSAILSDPRKETEALCTSEFSDISPMRGGFVNFMTLEGRPSAYNFENRTQLQEWVGATDILITLDGLNTFGDEVFGDPETLKMYFYAISDISIGATCQCNGHAEECIPKKNGQSCKCEHNTTGENCEQCLPFHHDQPWGRANSQSAMACKKCNCNGFSDECYFDEALHKETGSGGHCVNCRDNRSGPNCERCEVSYKMDSKGKCLPASAVELEAGSSNVEIPVITDTEDECICNDIGATSPTCNPEGKCQCKFGVKGDKCDYCDTNFSYFGGSWTCLRLNMRRYNQWIIN